MRATTLDARLQVRAAWEGVVGTSPSVALLNGGGVVRRNYTRNPRLRTLNRWRIGAGYSASPTPDGVLIERSGGSGTAAFLYEEFRSVSTPGERWSASLLMENVGESPITFFSRVYADGANGGFIAESRTTLTPGERARIVAPSIRPTIEGSGNVRILLYPVSAASFPTGGRILASDALLEKAENPGPYFDGSTTDPEVLMHLYAPPPRPRTPRRRLLAPHGWVLAA